MRPYMSYIQTAFLETTRWDRDNSYASLTASPRALLFFETPRGLRLNVSALSTLHSASSYDLGNVGTLNGSLSYLYSSLPINHRSRSNGIELRDLVRGYRHVQELQTPTDALSRRYAAPEQDGRKDTLLYGRLFLPTSTLEALYMRRLSQKKLLRLSAVSDSTLPSGGTILASLQNDIGKYSTELLYSTDSALLGVRGLYNFGYDPREPGASDDTPEELQGRISAGGELYYGILNKSGGASAGLRFTTLPRYTGFPYTMTLTLNPLMGNLSSTYAVKAGDNLALSSQFDFNFYSYESDLRLGCEIWRRRRNSNLDWARNMIRDDWKQKPQGSDEETSGVLKARWDQNWNIGILWEGRFKELLFSLGVSLDMQKRDQIFRAVGAELRFSS
ncbi:MAG: Mitochondrial distribution and morphology protein 10 [Chrysothrix sp. TS-e1954]|nr:MAG: Mitochondrial distribution and morphology protein 10 [Chrysothrix sp. TS-e1954]